MKELSIEEKAKRYNNAIKRAKELQHDNCWVTSIFPELKESEDEKIRKDIIVYLQYSMAFDKSFLDKKYNWSQKDCSKWIAWLEKQGEQKPTDKVEPKFRIGDWIVNVNDGDILHINKVLEYAYEVTNLKGGVYESSRCSIETWYKLWTIQDAKDGDVLVIVDDKRPFIYKGCFDPNHPDSPVAYFGISTGEYFCKGGDNFDHWWTDVKVQPATKEQRDILFQKMKEAGYEWDAETKELKIEEALEVKEVNLESEVEKCLKKYQMLAVGKKDFTCIAKHFFELGLKAIQKGENYDTRR